MIAFQIVDFIWCLSEAYKYFSINKYQLVKRVQIACKLNKSGFYG